MDFSHYLKTIDSDCFVKKTGSSLYERTTFYKTGLKCNLSDYQIAFLGLADDRNSNNDGASSASHSIRTYLYGLQIHTRNLRIIDLGNVITGATVNDTYFALREIIAYLSQTNIIVVVFGASQDMMVPIVSSSADDLHRNKISIVDSRIDIGDSGHFSNLASLFHIDSLQNPPEVSLLASQNYLVPSEAFEYVAKQKHRIFRLGRVKEDIRKTEPVIRDSYALFFDIGAIRQCDAPANINASPNGLNAEEACQMCRYFGVSDQSQVFHISEINPSLDHHNQTSHLAAQLIWHFIDGVSARKVDYPASPISLLQKYVVSSVDSLHDITFYKSQKTERWWIEIDANSRSFVLPCNPDDYQTACNNVIPDIYLDVLSKLTI